MRSFWLIWWNCREKWNSNTHKKYDTIHLVCALCTYIFIKKFITFVTLKQENTYSNLHDVENANYIFQKVSTTSKLKLYSTHELTRFHFSNLVKGLFVKKRQLQAHHMSTKRRCKQMHIPIQITKVDVRLTLMLIYHMIWPNDSTQQFCWRGGSKWLRQKVSP